MAAGRAAPEQQQIVPLQSSSTVVEHNATAGAFHVHPGRDIVHGSWAGDIVHGPPVGTPSAREKSFLQIRDLALVSQASTAHFRRAGQHALLHQVVSCRADGTTEITQLAHLQPIYFDADRK